MQSRLILMPSGGNIVSCSKYGGKQMYDCHMHTRFSTDGLMDADEACKTAIKLGLEGVAFTDHLDYDYPGEENFLIDFDKYFLQ